MYKKVFLSSLLLLSFQEIQAQPFELTPVVGRNFFDSDTALKNANFFGIRATQYINCNNAIQLGYDHINSADYKSNVTTYNNRSLDRTIINPSSRTQDNNYNSGTNGSTNIDRYFINGVHDLYLPNPNIRPFVFAGLGYENVEHETNNLKSQGFFDAGAGLKIPFADNVNLYSEAKAIKKFDDSSLDFALALGVGFAFGQTISSAPATFVQSSSPEIEMLPQSTPVSVEPTTIVAQEPQIISNSVESVEEAQPIIVQEQTPAYDGEYYIQLAAIFHSNIHDDDNIINAIQDSGEPFSIKDAIISGRHAKLLLAGPYMSHQDAQSILPQMRTIQRGAFIKRIEN